MRPYALLVRPARNLTATMTTKDVSATITVDRATFVPIAGKTKDNNLLYIREFLTPILLGIPYNTVDGDNNLWGILSSDATYKAQHREEFSPPTRPAI